MRPLEGVRVLAVENFIAGPYGSMLLADHGAEVIKVEPPRGDTYRAAVPHYEKDGARMSYSFLRVNRNKRSIVLDLATSEGRDAFLELVDTADVVWENLRPGAFERLDLGWEVLRSRNPRIVYASLTGFGSDDVLPSPFRERLAFDIVAQALSGMMYRVGHEDQEPLHVGTPVADTVSAILAALGVSLALNARQQTGVGQRVDISLYDAMVALNEQSVGYYSHFGEVPPRGASPTSAPFSSFMAADGYLAIGIASDEIWRRFCTVIEAPDLAEDPTLAHGIDRVKHAETRLRPRIEKWTRQFPVEEAVRLLNVARVPAANVQNVDDLFDCPHVEARKMLVELDDPVAGRVRLAANPIKLSDSYITPNRTAPQLGADQDRYLPRERDRDGTVDRCES